MHYHGNGELSIVDSYIYANNNKKIIIVTSHGNNDKEKASQRNFVRTLCCQHSGDETKQNTQYSVRLFLGQPPY